LRIRLELKDGRTEEFSGAKNITVGNVEPYVNIFGGGLPGEDTSTPRNNTLYNAREWNKITVWLEDDDPVPSQDWDEQELD